MALARYETKIYRVLEDLRLVHTRCIKISGITPEYCELAKFIAYKFKNILDHKNVGELPILKIKPACRDERLLDKCVSTINIIIIMHNNSSKEFTDEFLIACRDCHKEALAISKCCLTDDEIAEMGLTRKLWMGFN